MTRPAMFAGIPIPRRVLDMRDRAHGLIDARNRAAAAQLAGEHDLEPTPRATHRPAVFDGLERPALQGLACQYDAPFVARLQAGAESDLGLVVVQANVA